MGLGERFLGCRKFEHPSDVREVLIPLFVGLAQILPQLGKVHYVACGSRPARHDITEHGKGRDEGEQLLYTEFLHVGDLPFSRMHVRGNVAARSHLEFRFAASGRRRGRSVP